MEHEVRFYFSKKEYEKIINRLKDIPKLHSNLKLYENTIQYNHPEKKYDFYSKKIDGRFRLRIAHNELMTKCKLSWKQRLTKYKDNDVSTELEKEVRINPNDIDNFIYIIENVMHFKIVESYERYRTIFENNDIEIAVDEYPFGICIKIENKSYDKNPYEVIKYWVNLLGLKIDDANNLSWDDMYEKICLEQGIDSYKEVTFDKTMPDVKNKFK